jgi:GH24 family phage-related lysozyme (muramidase)
MSFSKAASERAPLKKKPIDNEPWSSCGSPKLRPVLKSRRYAEAALALLGG